MKIPQTSWFMALTAILCLTNFYGQKKILKLQASGITLIDDENKNGEICKKRIAMPEEVFGFFDFFMQKIKKSFFDDFKITLKEQNNKISITVKYI